MHHPFRSTRPLHRAGRGAWLLAWGLTLACWLSPNPATAQAEDARNSYERMGARLGERVAATDWGGGRIGIAVQDLELPLTVYEQNAQDLIEPGGVLQLVTAAAALEHLGPQFKMTTELIALNPNTQERTAEGLLIRGTGDPSLSRRDAASEKAFWAALDGWARLLKKSGIRTITGPVIGDGTAFDDQWSATGWPAERLGEGDLPSISALNFNHNCFDIQWSDRGRAGSAARFQLFPSWPDFIFFKSNVQLTSRAYQPRRFTRVDGGTLVVATGQLLADTQALDHAAVLDPPAYFARAMKDRLQQEGIAVDGPAVNRRDATIDPGTMTQYPLDVIFSPPLEVLLRRMMNEDRTLEAEVTLKAMGRRAADGKQPGSWNGGLAVVNHYLRQLRLPGIQSVLTDGSGRSQLDRLTAQTLVAVLRKARNDSGTGTIFESLLPRAGDSPNLAGRFVPRAAFLEKPDAAVIEDQPVPETEGSASGPLPIMAKAASGEGQEALAGLLKGSNGRWLAFAILVEGSTLPQPILRQNVDDLALTLVDPDRVGAVQ